MRKLLFFACLALGLPAALHGQGRFAAATTIGRVDSVWSAVLKEQRPFLVYTPPSYRDTTFLPRQYPVLYVLDGDAHFHSITGLLQILGTGVNGTFVVPEMIVVAIPNTDRTRDLTPTRVETDFQGKPQPFLKTSGGNPAFFRFLETELIPRIEADYRTAPYRVLVGHSFGGITAINALYTVPKLFNAYVAIDPSLWYDNQILLRQARAHFEKPGLEGKALYVGQANTINPDDTTSNVHFSAIVQFNGVAERYNRSGLRYAYRYYPEDDHGSVPLIAEYDALRFIFAGYKVDLLRSLENPRHIVAHFDEVSRRLGFRMQPPESMVDMIGRFQLARDTAKAIQAFELNAELYPRSPRAHATVGDAWMKRGDRPRAMAAFERALALNPRHSHAAAMIKELGAGGKQ